MLLGRQKLRLLDPLALQLEQALLAGQTNVKAALGSGAAQPCTLTASHQHHGDAVLGDEVETALVPFVEVLL